MRRPSLLIVVAGLLALFIPGVHAQEAAKPDGSSREALTARAEQYLEALRLKDFVTAYRLESDAKTKTLTPHRYYQRVNAFPPRLLRYEIKDVHVEGQRGTVDTILVQNLPPMRKPLTTQIPARWVLIDGEWYHRTEKPMVPRVGQ